MASELETSIKNAATKLAKALEDASEINIETRYIQVAAGAAGDSGEGKLAAKTVITLDGDTTTTVPVSADASGSLTIVSELLELHQRNVTTAIEYRERLLNALLALINYG